MYGPCGNVFRQQIQTSLRLSVWLWKGELSSFIFYESWVCWTFFFNIKFKTVNAPKRSVWFPDDCYNHNVVITAFITRYARFSMYVSVLSPTHLVCDVHVWDRVSWSTGWQLWMTLNSWSFSQVLELVCIISYEHLADKRKLWLRNWIKDRIGMPHFWETSLLFSFLLDSCLDREFPVLTQFSPLHHCSVFLKTRDDFARVEEVFQNKLRVFIYTSVLPCRDAQPFNCRLWSLSMVIRNTGVMLLLLITHLVCSSPLALNSD